MYRPSARLVRCGVTRWRSVDHRSAAMDDMTIKSAGLSGIGDLGGAASTVGAGGHSGGSFLGSLKDAIAQVNEVQLDASQAVDKFVTGESENVHPVSYTHLRAHETPEH